MKINDRNDSSIKIHMNQKYAQLSWND